MTWQAWAANFETFHDIWNGDVTMYTKSDKLFLFGKYRKIRTKTKVSNKYATNFMKYVRSKLNIDAFKVGPYLACSFLYRSDVVFFFYLEIISLAPYIINFFSQKPCLNYVYLYLLLKSPQYVSSRLHTQFQQFQFLLHF